MARFSKKSDENRPGGEGDGVDRLRAALAESRTLRAIDDGDRDEILDDATFEIARRYAHLPFEQRLAVARKIAARTWARRLARRHREAIARGPERPSDSAGRDPALTVQARELKNAVFAAVISDLTPRQQFVILHRFFRDETLSSIAARLSISTSLAHKIVADALQRLQRSLAEFEDLVSLVDLGSDERR